MFHRRACCETRPASPSRWGFHSCRTGRDSASACRGSGSGSSRTTTSQRLWVDDHDSLPSPEELETLRDLGRSLDVDVGSLFRYLDRPDERIPEEYLAWTDPESATLPSAGRPALFRRRRRPPRPEPISARNRTRSRRRWGRREKRREDGRPAPAAPTGRGSGRPPRRPGAPTAPRARQCAAGARPP